MPEPMPDQIADAGAGPSLGERIRERRKAVGLTLKAVADAAGLTAGFISQIERGLAQPSITSLTNVAQVLDLDPAAFLVQPPTPDMLTRQGQRPVFGLAPELISYERVSSHFPGNVLRANVIHEAPGHHAEPISHEGEEIFFIISGRLMVELDGQRHRLDPGDSIHFASVRVHSTWNPTTSVTTYLHVCTMDVFGDDRREAEHTRPPVTE